MKGRIIIAAGMLFAAQFFLTSFTAKEKGLRDGDLAPEISLPTPKGDTLKLSSLHNHMVLVHFWASWCEPCKHESPKVEKLYNEYKDKEFKTGNGLIVLNVSLDNNKSKWEEAINQEGFSKNYNISDLKSWKGIVAASYKVTYVPDDFLIDGDGKIVAQGMIINELDYLLKDELVKNK